MLPDSTADSLATSLHTHSPHRRTDVLRRFAKVLPAVLRAESTLHRKIALHLPRRPHGSQVKNPDGDPRVSRRSPHTAGRLWLLLPLLPDGKRSLIMDCMSLGRADAHEDVCPHLALQSDAPEHPAAYAPRWHAHSPRLVDPAPSKEQLTAARILLVPGCSTSCLQVDGALGSQIGSVSGESGARFCAVNTSGTVSVAGRTPVPMTNSCGICSRHCNRDRCAPCPSGHGGLGAGCTRSWRRIYLSWT